MLKLLPRKCVLLFIFMCCFSILSSHQAVQHFPSSENMQIATHDGVGVVHKKKSQKKKSKKKQNFIPSVILRSKEHYQYRLAIASMFKNEAHWLKEWLEYHILLGVQHFYLYNNDSTDNYLEVLEPYINTGIVELIQWKSKWPTPWIDPGDEAPRFCGYQLSAFNLSIKLALHKVQWLGILDIDEYLVPENGKQSLYHLLDEAELENIGSLQFPWKCYGSSYLWDIPKNFLMTELLMLRAEKPLVPNTHAIKSLHRPETVSFCEVHIARLWPGFRAENVSHIRINHYQLRGRKNALFIRCGKTLNSEEELSTINPATLQCLNYYESLFNLIEDRTIEQYLPELKKAMNL